MRSQSLSLSSKDDDSKKKHEMLARKSLSNNYDDDSKKKRQMSDTKFQNPTSEEKKGARTFDDDFEEHLQKLSIFTEKAKKRLSTPDKNCNRKKNNLLLSKSNDDLNLSASNNGYLKVILSFCSFLLYL
jgi:hypothetical protein